MSKQIELTEDVQNDFDAWMKALDNLFFERYGISTADLPDASFRDMFDDGFEVRQAFDEIVEEQGYDTVFMDLEEEGDDEGPGWTLFEDDDDDGEYDDAGGSNF